MAQRVRDADAVGSKPVLVPGGPAQGYFQTDLSQPPTILPPDWCNTIQDELGNVVEDNGGTLDPTNDGQLSELLTPNLTDVTITIPVEAGKNVVGFTQVADYYVRGSFPGSEYRIPLQVDVGTRLTAVGGYGFETGAGAEVRLVRQQDVNVTNLGSCSTFTGVPAIQLTNIADHVVAGDSSYYVLLLVPGGYVGNFDVQTVFVMVNRGGVL